MTVGTPASYSSVTESEPRTPASVGSVPSSPEVSRMVPGKEAELKKMEARLMALMEKRKTVLEKSTRIDDERMSVQRERGEVEDCIDTTETCIRELQGRDG